MLRIENLNVAYGHLQILWGVSLEVGKGEVVAILGPNGAGKTTLLKSLMGLVPARSGRIFCEGLEITRTPTFQLARLGLSFVPEERNIFPAMTVEENLLLGAYVKAHHARRAENLAYVYELFPRLLERRRQLSGTMSGGERQMLAIGRGLMSNPKMLILDEPSMGLSPTNVLAVFEAIAKLTAREVTILIVEQNVNTTLKAAGRAYVMEQGRVVLADSSANLLANDHVQRMYLGLTVQAEADHSDQPGS
jgi:branched-chain amino acid transport system ATP-binding protein